MSQNTSLEKPSDEDDIKQLLEAVGAYDKIRSMASDPDLEPWQIREELWNLLDLCEEESTRRNAS